MAFWGSTKRTLLSKIQIAAESLVFLVNPRSRQEKLQALEGGGNPSNMNVEITIIYSQFSRI